jgi:ribose/xylose/arabinose/galactoside ABC-type transport system permease subunit
MAISGSVIGGTFLTGGVGSVPGIILGGLTISIIENALTMLGISYFLAWAIYGSLILSYVLFYMYLEKRLAVIGGWRG